MKFTVLTSPTYKLNSFLEVTAFFLISLWSCDQLSLLLKYLIGKHLEINGFHRGKGCTICPRKKVVMNGNFAAPSF